MTQSSLLNPETPPHVFIQTIPNAALIALIRPFTIDGSNRDRQGRMNFPEPGRDTRDPARQVTDNTLFQFQLYTERTPPFVVFPGGGNMDDFVSEYCDECPYYFGTQEYEDDDMSAYVNGHQVDGVTFVGRIQSPCRAHRDGISDVESCIEYPAEFDDAADRDPEPVVVDGTPFMFSTTYRLGGWYFDRRGLQSTNVLVAAKHHAGACTIAPQRDCLFPDGQPPVRIAPPRLRRSPVTPVFNVYCGLDICWGSQDTLLRSMGDCASSMDLFLSSPCNTDLNSIEDVEANIETASLPAWCPSTSSDCAEHTWRPSLGSTDNAIAIKGGGAVPAVALAVQQSSPAAYLQALAMGGIASDGIAVIPLMTRAQHKAGGGDAFGHNTISGWATFPDAAGLQWFIADQPIDPEITNRIHESSCALGVGARGYLCGQITDPDMLIIPSP